MPAYKSTPSLLTALARMAEELRQQILRASDRERVKLVTRILDESDMVFAVWPDTREDRPFGVQITKGEDLMPPLIGFETATEMRIAAIPCVGLAVALAAREFCRLEREEVNQQIEGETPTEEVCGART
jgi:hypothetical protein